MLVSLERWPSLADYLGQRELAYFKQIFFRDIKPLHGGRLQPNGRHLLSPASCTSASS